ncbi:hypothetical protein TNCV_4786061 [Trichonephila clavipes]|nr:hypothetical protein TNCV_4786061 [Trichonephila clavipes]
MVCGKKTMINATAPFQNFLSVKTSRKYLVSKGGNRNACKDNVITFGYPHFSAVLYTQFLYSKAVATMDALRIRLGSIRYPGLLDTDLVIFNNGKVTRATPQLTPPLSIHNPPTVMMFETRQF